MPYADPTSPAARESAKRRERRYKERHPEKYAEVHRAYWKRRQPEHNALNRAWVAKNNEKVQPSKKAAQANKNAAEFGLSERITPEDVREVFRATHCAYCGKPFSDELRRSLDHKVPMCRGGRNTRENLVASCWPCNLAKGKKLPAETD